LVQTSPVQGLLSLQLIWVLSVQIPAAEQVAVAAQALLGEQVAPSFTGKLQTPPVPHTPARWQASGAPPQFFCVPPQRPAAEQVSPRVQALPSSQAAAVFTAKVQTLALQTPA
jgi:hypothetical protein